MSSERARILPPYTRRVNDNRHLATKLVLGSALILFAMLMGFVIAVFGLRGWFLPAVPIVLLFLLALWMAPDMDAQLDGVVRKLYFLFFGLTLMWPAYIAINIPGLPWISFERLALLMMGTVFLYLVAVSSRVRSEIADVMTTHRLLFWFFMAWTGIQLLMAFVAQLSTFGRYVQYVMAWNMMFLISAWLMREEGLPTKLFRLLIIGIAVSALLVIPEAMQQKPIWADHIPAFLSIDPLILENLQFGRIRGDMYRAKSIFLVSVTYAEFVGMAVPLVLFTIFHAKAPWRAFIGLALLILLFTAGLMTQSRTAMVGFTVTIPLFMAMWVFRRYRTESKRRDIIAPALVAAGPAIAAAFAVAVLTIPRIRVRVLGGSMHQNSNDARGAQWDMAIPKIIQNPFGYGVDKLESVVPYYNGAGVFTVDSYPINLLVEYGVLGFLAWLGLFGTAIYLGVRAYITAENRDEMIGGPLAIAIFSFFVSRLVLSSEGAQAIAFSYAGVILALYWRQKQREPAPAPKEEIIPRFAMPPRQGLLPSGR
jgi:O-antigen ligase